jgi:hypothetical protein
MVKPTKPIWPILRRHILMYSIGPLAKKMPDITSAINKIVLISIRISNGAISLIKVIVITNIIDKI